MAAMISRSLVSLLRDTIIIVWLATLLVSALPNSYSLRIENSAEDDAEPDFSVSLDLKKLRSLLAPPDLVIEYSTAIDTPVDLKTKRYGFAGLDNLDVINRVLSYQEPDNMSVNRDSKFSIRQLMERHG